MAQSGQLARVVYFVGGIETALCLYRVWISELREADGGGLAGLAVSIRLQLSRLVVYALHLTISWLLLLLNNGPLNKYRLLLLLLTHAKLVSRRYILAH